MTKPAIGPVLSATLFSPNYQETVDAWCGYLDQHIHSEEHLDDPTAQRWGSPTLSGNRQCWLANELNEPWIRIIESPDSVAENPFEAYGWFSLEINVQDVDKLHTELLDSPFEIIGPPADLDVSDAIRAMQVIGPCGEVLYLTEVKAEVPPFELPFARCRVDRLFIPVGLVPDRAKALEFYQLFEHTSGLQFDTKITVINRALGFEIDRRHPVATVQLAGKNLVELDEVAGLNTLESEQPLPNSGVGAISFAVRELPSEDNVNQLSSYQVDDRPAGLIKGSAEELIELIKVSN